MTTLTSSDEPKLAHIYRLVHDEDQIRQFSRLFCDPQPGDSLSTAQLSQDGRSEDNDDKDNGNQKHSHNEDHCKIVSIFTRAKYMKPEYLKTFPQMAPIKTGMMIKQAHFECYRDDNHLVRHIHQLEVPLGSYTYRSKHSSMTPVPDNSLVVYMDLHTKSTTSASIEVFLSLQQQALSKLQPDTNIDSKKRLPYINQYRIVPEITSALHRAKPARGTTKYLDLDVDTKDVSRLQAFVRLTFGFLQHAIVCIIETYGGFHIVLNASLLGAARQQLNAFLGRPDLQYKDINRVGVEVKQTWIALNQSPQIPIAGCIQGGFPVRFVSLEQFMMMYNDEAEAVLA